MGEQYRRELMLQVEGSNELIKIDLKGEKKPIKVEFEGEVIPQITVGDICGGYWNNEMKMRNISENEMKTLDRINVSLPSLRTILRDIGRQFNSRYTIGDYLEEHGYEVTKNGKYVWIIKRR